MKKTFEVQGVDLTNLYGIGDKNILFLETQFPLKLNVRGNNIYCQGLKKDINNFDIVLTQMIDSIKKNSLEFFNTHGLPNKKLENWKFTSSRNFKNFSDPSTNSQNSVEFKADELSLVFINGILRLMLKL